MKHGTCSMYNAKKCRCDLCVTAHRDYHREYQRKNAQRIRDRVRSCPRCGQEFSGTRNGYCPPCHRAAETVRYQNTKHEPERKAQRRDSHLRRTYGIGQDDYLTMLASQDSKCAMCLLPSDDVFHVDHDHATGAVRGLLCGPCNTFLGRIESTPWLVASAKAYLTRVGCSLTLQE